MGGLWQCRFRRGISTPHHSTQSLGRFAKHACRHGLDCMAWSDAGASTRGTLLTTGIEGRRYLRRQQLLTRVPNLEPKALGSLLTSTPKKRTSRFLGNPHASSTKQVSISTFLQLAAASETCRTLPGQQCLPSSGVLMPALCSNCKALLGGTVVSQRWEPPRVELIEIRRLMCEFPNKKKE